MAEDGTEGLHLWRIAVNILIMQSHKANEGWSSSLGVAQNTVIKLLQKSQKGKNSLK
jgi:hypothetical protein